MPNDHKLSGPSYIQRKKIVIGWIVEIEYEKLGFNFCVEIK